VPSAQHPRITYKSLESDRSTSDNSAVSLPTVLTNPVDSGDIPELARLLTRAYETSDESICRGLPEPQQQQFFHDDYTTHAPSRYTWVAYCLALVHRRNDYCPDSDVGTTPNLIYDCRYFFQALSEQRNASPQFCLDNLGKGYTSSDDVRNCLQQWLVNSFGHRPVREIQQQSDSFAPFTEFELKLLACLEKSDECLFDLAQETHNPKVCELIRDPYEQNEKSRPACMKLFE